MTQALKSEAMIETKDQARDLQQTLVELIDLSLQAKHAHWNVVGPSFKPIHEFLDELTDAYRGWYDEVAERLTAIGVAPDGRIDTLGSTTPVEAMPPGPISDTTVLAAFDERVTGVAAAIRERADRFGEVDIASQDLLIEILRGLEKQRWMLRAHRA